jgi:hypothetical protein
MNVSTTEPPEGRDAFWADPPELPPGLRIARLESIVIPRVGPGGAAIYDLATLQAPAGSLTLLVSFRSPVLARDVVKVKAHLTAVIDERRRRQTSSTPAAVLPTVPAIATDVASPSVTEACIREGVALLDRKGTILVHAAPIYVHVVGRRRVERRSHGKLFGGKPCRIVRFLLHAPGRPFKVQEVANATESSYGYAHGVLTRLEREGFVTRPSPKGGYRLKDAAGLLRAWIESGELTAVTVEGYNAPATTPAALERAAEALRRAGVKGIFTLASALQPDELVASGLPHGIYLSGDPAPLVESLGLRRITPHNFLLLSSDPAGETDAGGIYFAPRTLPHGRGVALPQLAADFAAVGGRAREQAQHLLARYRDALPYTDEPA